MSDERQVKLSDWWTSTAKEHSKLTSNKFYQVRFKKKMFSNNKLVNDNKRQIHTCFAYYQRISALKVLFVVAEVNFCRHRVRNNFRNEHKFCDSDSVDFKFELGKRKKIYDKVSPRTLSLNRRNPFRLIRDKIQYFTPFLALLFGNNTSVLLIQKRLACFFILFFPSIGRFSLLYIRVHFAKEWGGAETYSLSFYSVCKRLGPINTRVYHSKRLFISCDVVIKYFI